MTDAIRVLFVCTANICRSPYMELRTREIASPDLVVSSAGTHGFVDHPMSTEMTPSLDSAAVDAFRSRRLTRTHVEESDLVLTAEVAHRRFILDDQPGAFRKVFTLGQFAAAVRDDDSDLTGRMLLERLGDRRGAADPELDVPDPDRRGAEIAASCSTMIDDLLRVVVPPLAGSRMIDG